MIAVIDYGIGNVRSVCKALEQVAPKEIIKLTSSAQDIHESDRIVFPGQGAISSCIKEIKERKVFYAILDSIFKKPFLGICLGMQFLYEKSEESPYEQGLGIFRGEIRKIPRHALVKVPHVGWNQVLQTSKHPLWRSINQESYFYFSHSYICPDMPSLGYVTGITNYGIDFVSACQWLNIFGVQFHPEKSGKVGLKFLENFVTWNGKDGN